MLIMETKNKLNYKVISEGANVQAFALEVNFLYNDELYYATCTYVNDEFNGSSWDSGWLEDVQVSNKTCIDLVEDENICANCIWNKKNKCTQPVGLCPQVILIKRYQEYSRNKGRREAFDDVENENEAKANNAYGSWCIMRGDIVIRKHRWKALKKGD